MTEAPPVMVSRDLEGESFAIWYLRALDNASRWTHLAGVEEFMDVVDRDVELAIQQRVEKGRSR